MIISHKYRFICFKTEKTASSSVRRLLRAVCSQGTIADGTDLISRRLSGGNADLSDLSIFPSSGGWRRRHLPQIFGLHPHATAAQVRQIVGDSIFSEYFKFSTERNPWDRQVSLYCHRGSKSGSLDVENFDRDLRSPLFRATHHTRLNNWGIYSIAGQPCVDFMIRYENLEEDIGYVLDRIGYRGDYEIPKRRSGSRARRADYRELYSEKSRRLVEKWYAPEIRHFGYSF